MIQTFQECASCASKPGSPTLCASCLNNRAAVESLLVDRDELVTMNTNQAGTILELRRELVALDRAGHELLSALHDDSDAGAPPAHQGQGPSAGEAPTSPPPDRAALSSQPAPFVELPSLALRGADRNNYHHERAKELRDMAWTPITKERVPRWRHAILELLDEIERLRRIVRAFIDIERSRRGQVARVLELEQERIADLEKEFP